MLADPRLEQLRDHPEFVRMQSTLANMEAAATLERTLGEEQRSGKITKVNR